MTNKCECGCGEYTKEGNRFINHHNRRGLKQSEEHIRKKSLSRSKKVEELHYVQIHGRAWKLFGKDKCELCGRTNKEHIRDFNRRLSMHCDGKRYRNMERIFWTTCCEYGGCHQKLELQEE